MHCLWEILTTFFPMCHYFFDFSSICEIYSKLFDGRNLVFISICVTTSSHPNFVFTSRLVYLYINLFSNTYQLCRVGIKASEHFRPVSRQIKYRKDIMQNYCILLWVIKSLENCKYSSFSQLFFSYLPANIK